MIEKENKFKLYAVFLPDPAFMIEFARRHIFSPNIGGLFSFAPFLPKSQATDFPKLGNGENWLFADSGSFSARNNNPQLFLKHPIDELFQYYQRFSFDYVVEPDFIVNDYHAKTDPESSHEEVYSRNLDFAAHVGILRSIRLKHTMGSEAYAKVVRPIHGHTAQERITYLDLLESQLDKVSYIALGGLDTKVFDKVEFEKTLTILKNDRGIKKIHFFGRSSADAIDYAISKLNDFDEVSLDSTSWLQKAMFRQAYWLEENGGEATLTALALKADTDENTFQENLNRLHLCTCSACNPEYPSLGKFESNDFFSLPFLAEQSRHRHRAYETLFVQKAALHNLCHQKMYIEHKLKTANERGP